jgi:hypothetical protein
LTELIDFVRKDVDEVLAQLGTDREGLTTLDAIQNFGAMDVLCTDKTGTLTLNKIVVEKHLDIHGNEDDRVLRHAYLNSFYQTGLRNLMDVAILEYGAEKGFNGLEKIYKKVDEVPFDFVRRRMSVVLESEGGKRQLVTKGAVKEMLSICEYAEYKGEVVPLTDEIRLIQSIASWPLLLFTSAAVTVGTIVPFTSFGAKLGMMPLPGIYFLFLIATLLAYLTLAQYVKGRFIKRFGNVL